MEMLTGNEEKDAAECPVCFGSFNGTEVCLDCGHSFCLECLRKIVTYSGCEDNSIGKVVCPMCRQLTHTKILQRVLNSPPVNATPGGSGLFMVSQQVQAARVQDMHGSMDNDYQCCKPFFKYFTEELWWVICLFVIVYLVLVSVFLVFV